MRAVARMVAELDGAATRLTVLRSEPPLLLRHTPAAAGPATVYLLAGAAGPIGGDDLRLELVVGEGASLRVHGIAASVALPAASGAQSRLTVAASVADGAELRWLPEQLIAAQGCHHLSLSYLDLGTGSRLLWREELVLGRHGESPGDVTVTVSLTQAGKPLLRQALQVGPRAPHWNGPGVLDGAKAVGCLIGVGVPGYRPDEPAVWMPLTGSAEKPGTRWMVTATASGAARLRAALTPAPLSVR